MDAEIKDAIGKLGPEVVSVSYRFAEDWAGGPSIFFRVVLTDAAAREDTLSGIAMSISSTLVRELQPIENWGLHPYFNFNSYSEQQNDPE